ncbi:MAG: aryl-alcohol dehydrogenase-like predicted oxidoreductase [Saprospiraceae bacterium]|jgi:aryl-alcohol dehydrogenase-like predicted oxidoreductase
MEFRKLGKTDIDVSVICLGTMTFGQQNSEAEAHEQLDYAIAQDVNFIDTAELYAVPAKAETQGLTEQYIGTWLAKRGKRDDLIIATKIAGPGPYTKHIRDVSDYSKVSISDGVDKSLKRLQTDYIDLYQLHWPARRTNFFGVRGYHKKDAWENNLLEVLQGLEAQVKAGKIRHIGISNETPWGLMTYLQLAEKNGLPRLMSIQNPYSLLNRAFEVGLSEIAIHEEVGLLAYSPMAFGRLSGKYIGGTDRPESRINQFGQMSRYNSDQCISATAKYNEIAIKYGMTLAQMSLAWVNQQQFVTANIIGATNLSQLKENIGSMDITLSKECVKEINAVQELIPNPAP